MFPRRSCDQALERDVVVLGSAAGGGEVSGIGGHVRGGRESAALALAVLVLATVVVAAVAARRAQVQAAAHSAGISFAFDRITSMPNTRLAHRLLTESASTGTTGALIERLFTAWFIEGQDIGDPAVLARLTTAPADDRTGDELRQHVVLAARPTMTGVPHFVFNDHVAVSGAQPPEVLLDRMLWTTRTQSVASAAR